jgi:hypothetical protein
LLILYNKYKYKYIKIKYFLLLLETLNMLISPYGFMIYYHNNKEFIEMKKITNTNINTDYIVKLNDFEKVKLIIEYFT